MSQAFPATQRRPRGIHRFDPANTNYVQVLFDIPDGTGAGGDGGTTAAQPIPDWVKTVKLTCAVPVRVAHRGAGVADGALIAAVANYTVIPADTPTQIPLRDGLPLFLSGVNTNEIDLVAAAMNVSV